MSVVERHVGRRADDGENLLRIELELVQDAPVGLEPGQVVLLLQTREPAHLSGARAEAIEPVLGNRVRDDDATCGPAAEAVLDAGKLVVEGIRGGDAEPAGDERKLVRSMR